MDKLIVYSRPDGGVSILVPAPEAQESLTDTQFTDWLAYKDVPEDATNVTVCDRSVLAADGTFRDAWVFDGSGIAVDLEKARVIATSKVNAAAYAEYAVRARNAGIWLINSPDDATWLAGINAKRSAVAAAASVADLLAAVA